MNRSDLSPEGQRRLDRIARRPMPGPDPLVTFVDPSCLASGDTDHAIAKLVWGLISLGVIGALLLALYGVQP